MICGAAAMLLASCEKELDFKYHDIDPLLVIEGSLTADEATVTLTLTTPMGEPMDDSRLTDAAVTLHDLTDGSEVTLLPGSDGDYIARTGGVVGHDYRLVVTREGESYSSDCEMSQAVEITGLEFNWIKMPYDDVAALQVSFADDADTDNDYYWVRIYRNGKIYQWSYVSDILESGGIIDEVFATTRKDIDEEDDDSILLDGDVITATVCKISREMYDYLEAIAQPGSNGPRMFEGGFCLGYFLAAPVTADEIVFHPDEIPYF